MGRLLPPLSGDDPGINKIEKQVEESARIKQEIVRLVEQRHEKTTPAMLEKTVCEMLRCGRKAVRSAVRDLVEEGRLKYTYLFGCAFVEPSFDRPVWLSENVLVKPPGFGFNPGKPCHVIEIAPGASFGMGDHPTTRIAIRGIEFALSGNLGNFDRNKKIALDIGTGSGILAILALKFGIDKAIGLDTDQCARTEAAENARINGFGDRFEIRNIDIGEISGAFALVTANLRLPTLNCLYPKISDITEKNGFLVVSGLRKDELGSITEKYGGAHFERKWAETEKDWAGAVFIKRI